MCVFITNSADETELFGNRLGVILHRLKPPVTVFMYGHMGSGKTTMIKGIASAFGISSRDVGSASFLIAAQYETEPPFCHIDLYRLEGIRDAEDMGLWDYLYSEGTAVVEWAERLGDIKEYTLKVSIKSVEESIREITVEGLNEEDRHLLQGYKRREPQGD